MQVSPVVRTRSHLPQGHPAHRHLGLPIPPQSETAPMQGFEMLAYMHTTEHCRAGGCLPGYFVVMSAKICTAADMQGTMLAGLKPTKVQGPVFSPSTHRSGPQMTSTMVANAALQHCKWSYAVTSESSCRPESCPHSATAKEYVQSCMHVKTSDITSDRYYVLLVYIV